MINVLNNVKDKMLVAILVYLDVTNANYRKKIVLIKFKLEWQLVVILTQLNVIESLLQNVNLTAIR